MGLNIMDRIQQRIEIFRLEQRYTRNRNRRSTFQSNAVYVDGEYVYNTPNTTGSSSQSSKDSTPATSPIEAPAPVTAEVKASRRLSRWSSVQAFGSVTKVSRRTVQQDWRANDPSLNEVR